MPLIAFIIGLLIGCGLGIFITILLVIAGGADELIEQIRTILKGR